MEEWKKHFMDMLEKTEKETNMEWRRNEEKEKGRKEEWKE